MRVFENRVLRRIFGPKRGEVLFAKYNWNDQVEEDKMGRACCTHWGEAECM
jgi:hypothetical protein